MPQLRRGGSRSRGTPHAGGGVGTLAPPDDGEAPPGRGRSRRRYDPAWDDWKHPRRWPGVLLTCVVVLAFIGVVVWHYRPHTPVHKPAPAGSNFPKGRRPKPAFVIASTGPHVEVRTFHGTHSRKGLRFATNGSLLVLHAKCACTYNFDVTITSLAGTPELFPVSTTGAFDASLNVTLPAGTYVASVIAPPPAAWSLQFIQPGVGVHPIHTPFKYFSNDLAVLGPFSSADRALFFRWFSATNQTARVYVLSPSGARIDQAFAGTEVARPQILPNPPNPYYVEVDASGGFWQLNVGR